MVILSKFSELESYIKEVKNNSKLDADKIAYCAEKSGLTPEQFTNKLFNYLEINSPEEARVCLERVHKVIEHIESFPDEFIQLWDLGGQEWFLPLYRRGDNTGTAKYLQGSNACMGVISINDLAAGENKFTEVFKELVKEVPVVLLLNKEDTALRTTNLADTLRNYEAEKDEEVQLSDGSNAYCINKMEHAVRTQKDNNVACSLHTCACPSLNYRGIYSAFLATALTSVLPIMQQLKSKGIQKVTKKVVVVGAGGLGKTTITNTALKLVLDHILEKNHIHSEENKLHSLEYNKLSVGAHSEVYAVTKEDFYDNQRVLLLETVLDIAGGINPDAEMWNLDKPKDIDCKTWAKHYYERPSELLRVKAAYSNYLRSISLTDKDILAERINQELQVEASEEFIKESRLKELDYRVIEERIRELAVKAPVIWSLKDGKVVINEEKNSIARINWDNISNKLAEKEAIRSKKRNAEEMRSLEKLDEYVTLYANYIKEYGDVYINKLSEVLSDLLGVDRTLIDELMGI